MKLVEDWKKCYKWFSVQAMTLSSIVLASWNVIPDDMREAVNHKYLMIGASILLALGVLGRLVDQSKP